MSQHLKVLPHVCSPLKRCRSDNTISLSSVASHSFPPSERAGFFYLVWCCCSSLLGDDTRHGAQLLEYRYDLVPCRETEMAFRFKTTTETTAVAATNSGQLTCTLYHQQQRQCISLQRRHGRTGLYQYDCQQQAPLSSSLLLTRRTTFAPVEVAMSFLPAGMLAL